MKRFVLTIVALFLVLPLFFTSDARAQSPVQRIAKLRALFGGGDANDAAPTGTDSDATAVAARTGANNAASEQTAAFPPGDRPMPTATGGPLGPYPTPNGLLPGAVVPPNRIPLPPTYHGRLVSDDGAAPGPAGAKEPDVGRRGDDPWDLARRLGVADNPSYPIPEDLRHVDQMRQTPGDAFIKSEGCIHCHTDVGHMHPINSVNIGCTDCHGGDASKFDIQGGHVWPKFPAAWKDSANPVRSYTLLNHESPDFIRFMNPGDLRVAHIACGQCHANEVLQMRKSMMTHGCMLWGAALYNNGGTDEKYARYGESYSMNGAPQIMQTVPPPTVEETREKGVLPFLQPLIPYQVSQPGNVLRIFERGGRFKAEVGIPEVLEEPGRPRERLSVRGLGTENRTDPVFIGLAKTRLLDPTLNFLGTNDHPGDYRSSGCSSCHVLYANDRSETSSGFLAKYGNGGTAAAERDEWVQFIDPMIRKDQPGHPIQHKFELRMPTSQCMVCHIHPGTNVLNSYLGYMWWDNETDGELMYPEEQKHLTAEDYIRATESNPNEAAARGHWSDPEFLANVTDLNPHLEHTQFADFHGHGWVYRAVFKKNRDGTLLDWRNEQLDHVENVHLRQSVAPTSPAEKQNGKCRPDAPVHLMDIHMEKGMHCTDCHYYQDSHGNGKLYGEVRAAIEIQCIDCHGTAEQSLVEKIEAQIQAGQAPRLPTSGPAAPPAADGRPGGTNLLALRTTFNTPRFEVLREPGKQPRLIQRSTVEPDLYWEVVQTADTVRPNSDSYNPRSHAAKSVRLNEAGQVEWGGTSPQDLANCAHRNDNMSCITCHSSWNPSCFGCHLPQRANIKSPELHNTGDMTRNRTSYNFQTLRDDIFMLARDGNVTGNRIGPARSSCAIHVTSYNANREAIYTQQQTISGDGMSGIAFSTNVPHTVRGGAGWENESDHGLSGVYETKSCTDCHLSGRNDNNAIMAQLMMQGTGFTNFIGKYCYVAAGEHGFEAVVVTETTEPQAVIGSSLHKIAYPENFEEHIHHDRELEHSHEHPGRDIIEALSLRFRKPEILDLQHRGEYMYAACGKGGLRVFDIAFIDHKGFSERITTAPVSPLGQRLYVRTKFATGVAAPTTIAPDPTRLQDPTNEESAVHPLYGYLYVSDREEGLILVGAGTLLDGNPLNNFLERALTFNPDGILNGAESVSIVGTYAYVCCASGLVVVDLDDPTNPKVTHVIGHDELDHPHQVAVQFRYGFVTDHHGVKVIDTHDLAHPHVVHEVELDDAHGIYVARTYAYVAAGKHGLAILDIENPLAARVDQMYDADGCINDAHDVQLGITNVSQFAYVADGKNGLRVIQLTSPEVPGNDGFSPRPIPFLVASYQLPKNGHALAISRGMDRDRAVDESGNQIAVFGRVGARPLSKDETQKMYRRPDGSTWYTSDNIFDDRFFRFPASLKR
ncbi:LVIVD repeat protein [Rubripirellula lacrimiformis]|uniref:LVIVD repeat protein n=1 Tax=Rubripirellula lacrimiformis TaxID=1930273 RepID=A0A517NBD7_9BACT|nr:hypothetical protein [Rubripirellula lacrimiformis]QDT04452.1 LVIVD repeat protein [Rubripirellula lacrimiformis]